MGYQTMISMHFLDAIGGFKFSYVGANPWSLSGAGGVSCGGCSFACEYRSWTARGSTGKHWETPGLQGTAAQGIFPTNYLPGVTVHYIPSRLSIICFGYHVYRHVMPSITTVSQTKVLVLLWTGYFLLAFLLMAVIARFTGPSQIRNWRVTELPIKNRWSCLPIKNWRVTYQKWGFSQFFWYQFGASARSLSLQFLLGRLQQLPEAIRESERYGLCRKDLLQIMAEQRGFQAFWALCLTSYSYWYCVENAYHAITLLGSLVLSTHSVAEHLHQRVDFEMDLEHTPPPGTPKVTSQ